MQLNTIAALLSFALVAVTSPVANLVERTGTTPTCSQSQQIKCCNAVDALPAGEKFKGIPIFLGLGVGCIAPGAGGCLTSQKQTCCSNGNQVIRPYPLCLYPNDPPINLGKLTGKLVRPRQHPTLQHQRLINEGPRRNQLLVRYCELVSSWGRARMWL